MRISLLLLLSQATVSNCLFPPTRVVGRRSFRTPATSHRPTIASRRLVELRGGGDNEVAFNAYEWCVNLGAPAALVAGAVLATLYESVRGGALEVREGDGRYARLAKKVTTLLLLSAFALQIASIFVTTVTGTVLLSRDWTDVPTEAAGAVRVRVPHVPSELPAGVDQLAGGGRVGLHHSLGGRERDGQEDERVRRGPDAHPDRPPDQLLQRPHDLLSELLRDVESMGRRFHAEILPWLAGTALVLAVCSGDDRFFVLGHCGTYSGERATPKLFCSVRRQRRSDDNTR